MGKQVLLVEDDASLARSIVGGLSEEGFAVSHVADGDSAREALRAGDWDLVILDWWLPGTDGLEILEGHRREGGNTPVLFLTARDAVSDRVRGAHSTSERRTTTCASRFASSTNSSGPAARRPDPSRTPGRAHDPVVPRRPS